MANVPISNNPNVTSGVAARGPSTLKYPASGSNNPSNVTRLTFVEYNRLTTSKAREKMNTIVTLPLPLNFMDNYSIRTNSSIDLGTAGMINDKTIDSGKMFIQKGFDAATTGNAADNLRAGIPAVTEQMKAGKLSTLMGMQAFSKVFSSSDSRDAGAAAKTSAFMGTVVNPHTTVLFDGVNLRSFTLDWRFAPESRADSEALYEIFRVVKMQSHPAELLAGYALNYPDLVYVEFDGISAKYLPKYQKSFINNINISPDSNAGINIFNSGAPTTYNFQLTFTELAILTRNTIASQYGIEMDNGAGDVQNALKDVPDAPPPSADNSSSSSSSSSSSQEGGK